MDNSSKNELDLGAEDRLSAARRQKRRPNVRPPFQPSIQP